METNIQNQKIAIITGGSRGIGRSIAMNAAKRGIAVILTYNNNPEQGAAVAEEINKNGEKLLL
ncbi:SDR family NAD(P)-dependent oxidoreductase [Chryseobacterium wanjuense]